ncbi:UDP-3-O-(3-hydroxymyristoyl)glucosamine N-acyltransferase [Betaproteobacteria bacterium PRO7]|nr:UDP-3-O-(3-hydroxymyristoyl)glucosamine N-acyltransferase [Betaproteobacteria bacterium PRO7]
MAADGLTVAQLAAAIERSTAGRLVATISGDADRRLASVAPLETADGTQLGFLANPRYRPAALASRAGAIVLDAASAAALFPSGRGEGTTIVCDAPYAWFALAAQQLTPAPTFEPWRAESARIAPTATVDASARIDELAVIEAGARIGPRAWVGAGCYVGADAAVGEATRLHPGARLLAGCAIGARGIVHAGAVIGADGFGFAPLDGRWIKIPQTGRVVIGDDVEVGANTTIDRGTMGDTVVEDGVKMDNQIQIGHNCRIGAHTVIAGCVGIAGSATIGRGCQLGGAAMILGHLSIADGTIISSGTLVSRTIGEAGFYTGFFPLMKNREWERNAAALRHLDELRERVRKLEARLLGNDDA